MPNAIRGKGIPANFGAVSTNLTFASSVVNPTISQTQTSSGSGQTLTIGAQSTTANSQNGGGIVIQPGAGGSGGATGSIYLLEQTPGTPSSCILQINPASIAVNAPMNFSYNLGFLPGGNYVFKQQDQVFDGTTHAFTFGAQNAFSAATGSNQNGGNLVLVGGNSTSTGSGVGGVIVHSSGITFQTITITTATYTCDTNSQSSDCVILVNRSGAVNVTLPAQVSGRSVTIKDKSGAAASNNITVTPASGTIDGSSTKLINTNYGSLTLVSDGTNWFITAKV